MGEKAEIMSEPYLSISVDYFNDPDAKEDQEEEEKFVPKPYTGGITSKGKSSKQTKGKKGDKKAAAPKKAATGQKGRCHDSGVCEVE